MDRIIGMNLAIVFLALIFVALAEQFPECRCPDGYLPEKDNTGKVSCYGILLRAIKPCNLPQHPRCKCGPEVTGIVTDAAGTWCATFQRGKEVKRWPCENTEEWEAFHRQNS